MVNILQAVFSILNLSPHIQYQQSPSSLEDARAANETKHIAIVGAGSAGLAMLKTLLDLPKDKRQSLYFTLFEEREEVGGIWLPDYKVYSPPTLPETPLYPLLRTNTPVPSMTYPNFPFPPKTPLFPRHPHILAYHKRFAEHFNLYPHIQFQHQILQAHWTGVPDEGKWNITVFNRSDGSTRTETFDHIVVATGNNHYPQTPEWTGQEEWLADSPPQPYKREIIHSIYYKGPERYSNRSVLVVGGSASGRDTSSQIVTLARKTYISLRHDSDIADGVEIKPEISHFTRDGIVLIDGSILVDVDIVLLATGYEMRKPFLELGHTMIADPSTHANSSTARGLVSNLRYIFPLYQHILSLCHSYPPNALAFIGLPSAIANCPSDTAQSLFVTHIFLNSGLLPPKDHLLKELAAEEENVRDKGFDPYSIGHKLLNGTSHDYQDNLVQFLKKKGALPDDGKKFVESWRREILDFNYMRRGWIRIEELGLADEWLEGVETEDEWAELMRRVNRWQAKWENDNGIAFVEDFDLAG